MLLRVAGYFRRLEHPWAGGQELIFEAKELPLAGRAQDASVEGIRDLRTPRRAPSAHRAGGAVRPDRSDERASVPEGAVLSDGVVAHGKREPRRWDGRGPTVS